MSSREITTRHTLFYLIIKWLSATADGFGRESVDRIASRNNLSDVPCNTQTIFENSPKYLL